MNMLWKQRTRQVLCAAIMGGALLATGCTVHAGYYDPYDQRYYAPADENTYIVQWEHETHRHHRDFNRRSEKERREYWQWRQQHRDHDHNR